MNKKASAAGREEVFLDISIQGDSLHPPIFPFGVKLLPLFATETEQRGGCCMKYA
jgi:hypothetical protein